MKKITALLVLTALLLSLTSCGETENVPELLQPMETANAVCVVTRSYLTTVQSTGGYVVPECEDLKFDYDTSAYHVGVELGEHVEEGQLLMELNPELAESIERLELLVVREQTEYDYDLQKFNNQLKNMRNYANMLGNSYDGRMVRLQMQEMQVNFDHSHASAAKKIEEDRAELEKLKKEANDAKVYAPCTGTIVYLGVSEDGDPIMKDRTFVSIAKDNTKLLACAFISRTDYDDFSSVEARIGNDVYEVKYIPYSDEEVYRLERTGNRFDSYFTADLKDTVEIGDYVQFVFTKKSAEPVLTVPTAAITKSGTQSTVQLVREGYMETVDVTIGESGINDTEILSGLSEGDVVYVAKNLARFGTNYETLSPKRETISVLTGCTGAKKIARVTEPFLNPVPGTIEEILVSGFTGILVRKGDPIFKVKCSVGRADQEQAKLDLRKYTDELEESKKELQEKQEELEKKMRKLSKSSLEYALAQLDLSDCKAEIAKLEEESQETIDKLTERIENFEKWYEQSVTVYAEKDCVISSVSKYKVGSNISENEILFETYDLDSYCICIDKPADDNRLRYGQKVELMSTVEGEELTFNATIISAPNVRPADVTDKNVIYVALDEPDRYAEVGVTGVVYYNEFNIANCQVIDDSLVYHNPKTTTQTTNKQNNQGQGGFGDFGWGGQQETSDYEEAESFTFDSEAHEISRGKAYVWVYDAQGCAVKRYVRVMAVTENKYWIVDGLLDSDVLLVH
ncbi:MAG: hypothetical protein IKX54_03385 [Lachnospiraceae bacterium]|nr:hypothetical protein [Lachnospiraceae bacterium]